MAVAHKVKVEKFVAAPHAEVLGVSMLSLPQNIKANEIMPLFARHGIKDIDPNQWYPQQTILNVYKDIIEGRSNVTENLVAIGVKSVETMPLPPEVQSVEAAITNLVSSYSFVHRNTWEGEGTTVKFLEEGHVHAILNVPYPEDIFYGYFWTLMKRFTPEGAPFRLSYVENTYTDLPGIVCDFRW